MPRGTNQLDKDGMTPGERAEAKRELVMAGRLQWWRHLMNEGLDHKAEHYATTYSLHELVADELAAMKKFKTVIAENPAPVLDPMAVEPVPFLGDGVLREELVAKRDLADEISVVETKAYALIAGVLTVEEAGAIVEINGWPVKCVGSVEKYPINPKMVIAMLPDGREVRLWNDGVRRWKLGAKVKMKLEEAGAEPIYVGDFDE